MTRGPLSLSPRIVQPSSGADGEGARARADEGAPAPLEELFTAALPAYVAICRGPAHAVERASAALRALAPRRGNGHHAGGEHHGATLGELVASAPGSGRLLALCDEVYARGEPGRALALPLVAPRDGQAGSGLWLDVAVAPRRDAHGMIRGVIVHGADVSAHVAARRESDAHHARLVEATRDAVRARDEFFSIATHELKTPLTVLQLKFEMLDRLAARCEALRSDELRRALLPVHRQLGRLGSLLDNLLDLARIRNQHLQLDVEVLDLCALVEETAVRLREAAQQAGCALEVETCGQPVVGYWDRLRLEQVVTNLLTNAFKYGAGRSVHVAVHADATRARVTVRDHGIGVAPEDHARIFERFERSTSVERQSSLGLGLYIVRAIVAAHGGRVWVESEAGAGAAFTVEVPIRRIPGDAPA